MPLLLNTSFSLLMMLSLSKFIFHLIMDFRGGAIQFFGTKRHHDKWLRDTETYAIKGCFAMSELGHGSNVREGCQSYGLGHGASGLRGALFCLFVVTFLSVNFSRSEELKQ